MSKFFFSSNIIVILAVGILAIYKGFMGDKDNASKVANKSSELVTSIADTVVDGAKDMAKEVKSTAAGVADSVMSKASEAMDSVKSSAETAIGSGSLAVKNRIGDIREASRKGRLLRKRMLLSD